MKTADYYHDIHWLASNYANRPDIVQGAGGNVSVKTNSDTLLVKASGREFADIGTNGAGLVPVVYKKLKDYLADAPPGADEGAHLDMVRLCTGKDAGVDRPSMEVWFHALLHNYVLHTHSVYVNVLSCSQEGSGLFSKLMQKSGLSFCIFPYYAPGFELGEAISKRLSTLDDLPSVIFLENHGVIVAADSAQECASIHDLVENKIKERLAVDKTVFDMSDLSREEAADFSSVILFPDQIIYPEHTAIRAAHRFILKHIKRNGFNARVIAGHNADVVKNMESEKHRKSLTKH